MKKLLLAILPLLAASYSYAQNINYGNETFSYNGFNVYHYGLGWYQDPATVSSGPMAYLSAFGGIKFFTTGGPKAVLDVNGFVGIGTMSPNAPLHILRTPSPNTDIPMQKWDPSVNGYFLTLSNYNSASGIDYRFTQYHAGIPYQVLTFQAGNVGIGTVNPGSMLDVEGGDITVHTANNQSNLVVGSSVGGKTYIRLTTSADANGYGIIQSVLSSGNAWGNTLINPLGGKVGIGTGTAQPDQALTVNGTIHATEVLVDQTIPTPDYVFDKDYDLATLKDVKTYIDQNHHLPEIPSAAQVAKEGINIGEMNARLLKKIEELTLYLIEKDKELSKEKLKNELQQKQLNKINKKLHID